MSLMALGVLLDWFNDLTPAEIQSARDHLLRYYKASPKHQADLDAVLSDTPTLASALELMVFHQEILFKACQL
jgi:hypothetical protein